MVSVDEVRAEFYEALKRGEARRGVGHGGAS